MSNAVWEGGNLDALFGKKEGGVRDWLDEAGDFLHECRCGHIVYDPHAVSGAVQRLFGNARANDVFDWAYGLAHRFGWKHQTSVAVERGIYYCQHCDPQSRK